MARRFKPGIDAPARSTVVATKDPRLTDLEKLLEELTRYLADASKAATWKTGKTNVSPAALWEAAPPDSRLRGYAMMLVSAVAGSGGVERVRFRAGQTRTKLRTAMSYVRSHAHLFLDVALNKPGVSPVVHGVEDFAANILFLRRFQILTDTDERYLDAMGERLEEESRRAAEQAADDAAQLERARAAAAEAPAEERLGRGHRKLSSRFAAQLEQSLPQMRRANASGGAAAAPSSSAHVRVRRRRRRQVELEVGGQRRPGRGPQQREGVR